MYVDSRMHDRRFEALGVINYPKCRAAASADRFGLWLDDCSAAEQIPQIPGTPIGIVGLRRFDNPRVRRGEVERRGLSERQEIERSRRISSA